MMQHTAHISVLAQRILLRKIAPQRILTLVLSVALVGSLCPLSAGQAYGDELSDKQAEAEIALANLNAMQGELDRLSNDYGAALMAQEEAEQKSAAAEARIEEIKAEIAVLQERLGNRARDMYRSGSASIIDLLLGSTSFVEFATNWDLLNKVNEQDAALVAEQKALRQEAEEQAAILAEQATIATENSQAAARAAAQAQTTVNEMQSIYDGLTAEVAELVEARRQAEEAAALERARIEAEREAARQAQEAAQQAQAASSGGSGAQSSYNVGADNTPVQQPYEGGSDPVSRAYACLGAPYVWGGTGPYGYDCSGLVGYALTGSHSRIGTTYTFMNWSETSDPQPGDICVNMSHTGIYIGGGQMIHAATYGVGVVIGPVQSGMKIVKYPG